MFEHALVGYIASEAVRREPVRLYYAFAVLAAAALFFCPTGDSTIEQERVTGSLSKGLST